VGSFYIFWSHLKKKIYTRIITKEFLPPKKRDSYDIFFKKRNIYYSFKKEGLVDNQIN
jgi:hypothetical protein